MGFMGNAKPIDCFILIFPQIPCTSLPVSVPPTALADAVDEALPYFPGRWGTHKLRCADVI